MKAHLRILGLLLVIGIMFAGCGSSASSSTQSSNKLTLWMVQSGASGDIFRKEIQQFQAAHPGVKVNVVQYSDDDIKIKVKTALVAHDLPDVFTWWGGSYIDPEIKSGELLDLAPYINAHGQWKSTFNADTFTNYTRGAKVYGVPNESPVVELWYNKALFAKAGLQSPPKTFDDLLHVVQQLNAKHITPISVGAKDGWPLQEWYTYLVMRDGGYQAIFNAMQGKQSWTSSPFVEAANQLQQLIKANAFEPGFLGIGGDTPNTLYYNQQAAMTLIGSWLLGDLTLPENKTVAQNTSFVDFPVVNGGQGSADEVQGGPNNCWVVNANTPNPSLAEDLIRYLTSSPQTNTYVNNALQIVPNKVANPSTSLPVFNAVIKRMSAYQHYNLFWNELLPSAASTQYIDLLQQMASGQISPAQMCAQFQSYMQQQSSGT